MNVDTCVCIPLQVRQRALHTHAHTHTHLRVGKVGPILVLHSQFAQDLHGLRIAAYMQYLLIPCILPSLYHFACVGVFDVMNYFPDDKLLFSSSVLGIEILFIQYAFFSLENLCKRTVYATHECVV
jgi:hypothetical protein